MSGLAHALKSVCGVAVLSAVFSLSLLVSTQAQAALALPAVDNQTFTVGETVSLTLPEATGGTAPYSYSLTSSRPIGLTFNAETRILSGTPTTTTPTNIAVSYAVTDGASIVSYATFEITVNPAPPWLCPR